MIVEGKRDVEVVEFEIDFEIFKRKFLLMYVIKVIVVWVLLMIYSLVIIWWMVDVLDDKWYWFLVVVNVFLIIDGFYIIFRLKG